MCKTAEKKSLIGAENELSTRNFFFGLHNSCEAINFLSRIFISEQIVWRSTCYLVDAIETEEIHFWQRQTMTQKKVFHARLSRQRLSTRMSRWIFLVRCSQILSGALWERKCGKMLLSWWKLVKNDPDVLSGCCSMEHETTNFAIKLMASKHLVDVFRRQKCVKNNGKYFTTRDDFIYSVWTRTFGSRLMDSSMCCVSLGVTAAVWE